MNQIQNWKESLLNTNFHTWLDSILPYFKDYIEEFHPQFSKQINSLPLKSIKVGFLKLGEYFRLHCRNQNVKSFPLVIQTNPDGTQNKYPAQRQMYPLYIDGPCEVDLTWECLLEQWQVSFIKPSTNLHLYYSSEQILQDMKMCVEILLDVIGGEVSYGLLRIEDVYEIFSQLEGIW